MKKVSIIAVLTVCAMLLTACGGTKPADTTANTTSGTTSTTASTTAGESSDTTSADGVTSTTPAEMTKAIMAEISIMAAVEKGTEGTIDLISGLEADKIKSASLYLCGAGAMPDEVAVIEFNSTEDATAAVSLLKARVDELTEEFKNYTPDEVYKLEGAKTGSNGNYAYLLACEDNDKALSILNGMF